MQQLCLGSAPQCAASPTSHRCSHGHRQWRFLPFITWRRSDALRPTQGSNAPTVVAMAIPATAGRLRWWPPSAAGAEETIDGRNVRPHVTVCVGYLHFCWLRSGVATSVAPSPALLALNSEGIHVLLRLVELWLSGCPGAIGLGETNCGSIGCWCPAHTVKQCAGTPGTLDKLSEICVRDRSNLTGESGDRLSEGLTGKCVNAGHGPPRRYRGGATVHSGE